jgi:hypothetical protein
MAQDDAFSKLARQIDAAQKAERFRVDADEVLKLRRQGACDLHRLCADFVSSLNGRLSQALVDLSPPQYSPELFRDHGPNLIQVSAQGRQMQIAFQSPAELASTEKFGMPYVLEGELRMFNQRMLDRFEVRSRLIFFCLQDQGAVWRFFDWRTRTTGVLAAEVLANLMEPLFG